VAEKGEETDYYRLRDGQSISPMIRLKTGESSGERKGDLIINGDSNKEWDMGVLGNETLKGRERSRRNGMHKKEKSGTE